MATFMRLEDSPMFQKQICSLEVMADDLKNRCQILYKGSKKFLTALVEAHNGENSFADSLEAFGSGMDDPVSLSVGGCQGVLLFKLLLTTKPVLLLNVNNFDEV
ncbi:hypothetical protein V6N11_067795 [Hibiscus sabdariffa]|uniref:Uncharacterized protein n=1 Tax=Hibiscus sabdariffa TaxID=183260 RepID=A0ABR2SSR0_9ROSI